MTLLCTDVKSAFEQFPMMETLEEYPDEGERNLLWRARPNEYAAAFFNYHMRTANALGLTWTESLLYVAERRTANGAAVIALLRTMSGSKDRDVSENVSNRMETGI